MNIDRPSWLDACGSSVEETLKREEERLAKLGKQAQLWSPCCMYLLVRKLQDDYPDPVLECVTHAIESLSLATHGYYQSAISALRRELELALRSVAFRSDAGLARRYVRHRGIPDFSKLARRVFAQNEFREFREAIRDEAASDIAARVDHRNVCSFFGGLLSDVVHSPVAMWNMLSWDMGSTPQYSKEYFDLWTEVHEETQHLSLIWVLLAHEGMFQFIQTGNPQHGPSCWIRLRLPISKK